MLEQYINQIEYYFFHETVTSQTSKKNYIRKLLNICKEDTFSINKLDFACYLRHLLISHNNDKRVKIPINSKFDDQEFWKNNGYKCFKDKKYLYINIDRDTCLNWLTDDKVFEWFDDTKIDKNSLPPQSDPFMKEIISYENYSSLSQREAIKSLLFTPDGSNLVINLPTGSGKSSLFYVSSSLKNDNKLTLVIVPTISLAIDQSRRFKEVLKKEITNKFFYWDSTFQEFEKNEIKKKIRLGEQQILFVSPESVCGSLLPTLNIAAENDSIKNIFIDEAHLLGDWGDNFRFEYQFIPAIRNNLLKLSKTKFKTIFLSATFTQPNLEIIKNLFVLEDKTIPNSSIFQIFSSVFLRPEPKYYAAKLSSQKDQINKLIELIKHVPRPIIIYTSLVTDAQNIYSKMTEEGHNNIKIFHAKINQKDKIDIISKWNAGEVDIVIGTSAFGVGIDKADVRTVIHATVPETLDRYYQEVGRGGRDGTKCLSFTLYNEKNIFESKILTVGSGKRRICGWENAINRWKKMFLQKEQYQDNSFVVDTSIVGPDVQNQAQTDLNNFHNVMTLIIMNRAKMIQLYSLPLNEIDYEDDNWKKIYQKVKIKVFDFEHLNADNFKVKYEKFRDILKNNREKSNSKLINVLDGTVCLEDELSKIYEIKNFEGNNSIHVTKHCRGCPSKKEGLHYSFREPKLSEIREIQNFENTFKKKWKREDESLSKIYYKKNINSEIIKHNIIEVTKILVQKYEVVQILTDISFDISCLKNLHFFKEKKFIFFDNFDIKLSELSKKLPTISILNIERKWKEIPQISRMINSDLNFIILPSDIKFDKTRDEIFYDKDPIYLEKFLKDETI